MCRTVVEHDDGEVVMGETVTLTDTLIGTSVGWEEFVFLFWLLLLLLLFNR